MVINRLTQLGNLPNGRPAGAVADQPDRRDLPLPRGRPARGYKRDRPKKPSRTGILQRRFKAIPGVTDVTGWGGKTKTYDHHRRPSTGCWPMG